MALGFDVSQPGAIHRPYANPFRIQPVRTGFWQGFRQAQRNITSVRRIPQREIYIDNVIPAAAYRPATITVDPHTDTNLRSQVLQAAAERGQALFVQSPAQADQAAASPQPSGAKIWEEGQRS